MKLKSFQPDYSKIRFNEPFINVKGVSDNGGVISGTPTFAGGIVLDGTGDSADYTNIEDLLGIKSVIIDMTFGTTTEEMIDLDGGTHYLSASSGTVSATGFGTPTLYVDGAAGATITAARHRVVATTATAFDATAIIVGLRAASYADATIHRVILSTETLTATEVLDDYNDDTYSRLDAAFSDLWLPLRSRYDDGSNEVTENLGTLMSTVQVGDGSTSTKYPTFLSPNGAEFDGSDYLKLNTTGIDYSSSGITMGCLFSLASNQVGEQTLLANTFGGNNRDGITVTAAGVVAGTHYGGSFNSKSGTVPPKSGLHSVIFTWDGTTPLIYIDDVAQTGSANPTLSATTGFNIGSTPSQALAHRGKIFKPHVYPFAVTPLQARYLHWKMYNELNI